ncbi:MAG: cytochrome-c peroxidase [Roseateles sp.]
MRSLLLGVAALAVMLAAASEAGGAGAWRWRADELAVLDSLRLARLPPQPADPSNAVERQPAAVALGRRLFEDARLSRNGAVSCRSCHDPARQFQDGLPVSRGIATGTRRAMPIVGAGHATWLFWDGRKDSLWAQALGPLEDPLEHGLNRTRLARCWRRTTGRTTRPCSARCRGWTTCPPTPARWAARLSARPGPRWARRARPRSRGCSPTPARPSRPSRNRCR